MTETSLHVETQDKPVTTGPVGFAILIPLVKMSARSSTDRATGFYPVGWGFDSLRAHFCEADLGLVVRLTATLTASAVTVGHHRRFIPVEGLRLTILVSSCPSEGLINLIHGLDMDCSYENKEGRFAREQRP